MKIKTQAVLFPAILALSASLGSTSSAQGFRVTWAGERLTIVAAQAPLAGVLAEVARQTHIRVVDLEKVSGVVTADIRNALLLDALQTLLGGSNYMIRYSANSESADRVHLWTHAPASPAEAAKAVAAAAAVSPAASPAEVDDSKFDDRPIPLAPDPVVDEVARLHGEGAFDARATEGSLLALSKSTNPEVRIRALQSLALQGKGMGMEAIKAALADENPFVRAEAMDMLVSQSPGPESVGRLSELVQHPDAAVRGTAAMALGDQAGPEAELILNRALDDDDPSVRAFATQSLKQKQQKQAGEKPKR